MKSTIHDTAGNVEARGSPANRLRKVRQKIFGKLILLLPSLEQHAGWQKWEPNIGGRFPRKAYNDIILRSSRYVVEWLLVLFFLDR